MGQIVATLGLEAAQHDLYIHQMAGIHADKAKALYNVPDDYDVVSAFTLGYLGDVQNLPEEFRKNEKVSVHVSLFQNLFLKMNSVKPPQCLNSDD